MAENEIIPRGILRDLKDGDILVLESSVPLREEGRQRLIEEVGLLTSVKVMILDTGIRLANTGTTVPDGWASGDAAADLREGRAIFVWPSPGPNHDRPVVIGDPLPSEGETDG